MHKVARTIFFLAIALGASVASSPIAATGQSKTNKGSEGTKPAAVRACALLTKAEIKKLLGEGTPAFFDQLPSSEESVGQLGSECFYPGITIQLDAHSVAAFEDTRKRYAAGGRTTFQPVAGVGDVAYAYDQDAGKDSHVVGIYTKVGQHVLTLSMDVSQREPAESLRPRVLTLTKAAVAKLR